MAKLQGSTDINQFMKALSPSKKQDDSIASKFGSFFTQALHTESKDLPKKKSSLDNIRYMQCLYKKFCLYHSYNFYRYYLQRYAPPSELISFWLKYQLIEDALRYILNVSLDHSLFILVIHRCISNNSFTRYWYKFSSFNLNRFKDTLNKIDPTLERWSSYLTGACKYFHQKSKYNVLIELQVLSYLLFIDIV